MDIRDEHNLFITNAKQRGCQNQLIFLIILEQMYPRFRCLALMLLICEITYLNRVFEVFFFYSLKWLNAFPYSCYVCTQKHFYWNQNRYWVMFWATVLVAHFSPCIVLVSNSAMITLYFHICKYIFFLFRSGLFYTCKDIMYVQKACMGGVQWLPFFL